MTPLSRVCLTAAAALLVAPALSVPAYAAVALDCSSGPVSITTSNETYVLTGACGTVLVDAGNTVVSMGSVAELVVTGGNNDVTATQVGSVQISGGVNQVTATDVQEALVREGNHDLKVRGTLGRATLRAANATLVAPRATTVKVIGANNTVKAIRLATLKVTGANNLVRVKKGSTKVSVRGANNVVRVNRRS